MPQSDIGNVEVLIIGGGIVGAGILRDLALHGIDCLLVDKKDFSSQTSGSSSKMLHGGIRYLENLDFSLVHEALHEKNLWLKLTPHLAKDRPFLLPVFNDSARPLWMVKAGLILYDVLSGLQNTPHATLNKKQTLERVPGLRTKGLKGAGLYHDAIMDDVKLTLEVIWDAQVEGARAFNHVEVVKLEKDGKCWQAKLVDCITKKESKVCAKHVIFATGPFTDKVMNDLLPQYSWKPKILPSKGSHLWIDRNALPIKDPMVMMDRNKRVIFVVPQKGAVLVGTTEYTIQGSFYNLKPTEEEIQYLLDQLAEHFPGSPPKRNDVLSSFAGVRPLVREEDTDELGKTAREHKVFRPAQNIHVIVGGKYTTFRTMAQDVARDVVPLFHKKYNSDRTKWPLRRPSVFFPFEAEAPNLESLKKSLTNELPRTLEDLVVRRLGLPSKAHWRWDGDFDSFFESSLPLLNKFFTVDSQQIADFPDRGTS